MPARVEASHHHLIQNSVTVYLLNIFLCSNSFSSVLFSKAQKLQLYTIERCEVLHSCVHRRCFSGFTRSRDGGTLQDTVELCSDGGKEGRHQRSGRRLPRQKEPSDRSGDHLPPTTASSTPRMASLTAFASGTGQEICCICIENWSLCTIWEFTNCTPPCIYSEDWWNLIGAATPPRSTRSS